MATVKVVDLIVRAQTLLQDEDSVRWTVAELQYWLNDAYKETIGLRPDVNTQTAEFTCVAGPRQNITGSFPNAIRLVEVVRNLAPTSDMSSIYVTSRKSLDTQRRSWYSETPTATIELYTFDPRTPKEFLVYPPATTSARLEVIYSVLPAEHTLTDTQLLDPTTAETIRIDDIFATALFDYMMYRAYSKDAEQTAMMQRAVAHYQAFQNALGTKQQVDAASQPGVA
jgi:hypothetical protein